MYIISINRHCTKRFLTRKLRAGDLRHYRNFPTTHGDRTIYRFEIVTTRLIIHPNVSCLPPTLDAFWSLSSSPPRRHHVATRHIYNDRLDFICSYVSTLYKISLLILFHPNIMNIISTSHEPIASSV